MRIHLIYPDIDTYFYPGVHHGLASIIGVLRSNGHLVSLHHVRKEPSRNEILEVVQRQQPDLIGFSSITNQIGYVETWSRWIKQGFATPIICGGVHATLHPEEVIGFDGVDMICRGEGEFPMLDLANRWGRGIDDIENLWIKKGNGIIRNDLRPLIADLDALPYADYDLFDCKQILKDRRGDFAVLASRGCPYSCTYCCNHALRKVQQGKGKYFRLRSVDHVLRELELLTGKYPIRHLSFADDVFGLSRRWSQEFCEKYPRQFSLQFECNVRADVVDEELLESLVAANCTQISMGVEAGNEWLRRKVLGRNMSNAQIVKAFDAAHKLGIRTRSYNMIGLPFETHEMIEETISLNKRLAPDHIAVFFFYPYRGTALYEVCQKEGFLSQRHSTSYVSETVLELPTVTPKELGRLHARFYRYAIERELQSFHPVLRHAFKAVDSALGRFLGKRTIEAIIKTYLKFFRLFSLLGERA